MGQIVTYDQAKRLRELGFNMPCTQCYHSDGGFQDRRHLENYNHPNFHADDDDYLISAPTVHEFAEWLETQKHMVRIDVMHSPSTGKHHFCMWKWNYDNNEGRWERLSYIGTYDTRPKAWSKAVDEAIKLYAEIIKEEQK